MSFLPTVQIEAAALRHNLAVARRHAPGARVMAVIKADGYGHGLLEVARALEDADALAVARVAEGVLLRRHRPRARLVVLAGAHERAEVEAAAEAALELVIHHPHQLDLLAATRPLRPLACWLKLDTGMHRLGFPPHELQDRLARLRALPGVARVAGVLTHLANADDLGDDTTRRQWQAFDQATAGLDLPRSVANSAAILGWPDTHADWVRPGLMLYGASPFATPVAELRPVMRFSARLIAVKEVPRGAPVGYGGEWVAPEALPLGVVAAGYGDGYPREVAPGTPVVIRGRRLPIVGRVSMDSLMVDLRRLPEARIGDEVELWGPALPVEEIARAAGTIPYTLLCGITGRVVRAYR